MLCSALAATVCEWEITACAPGVVGVEGGAHTKRHTPKPFLAVSINQQPPG